MTRHRGSGQRRSPCARCRHKVRGADAVATKAVEAAQSQMTALPGEKRAAKLVCDLAHQLLALDERIKDNDREIRETFRTDVRAEIIESMPGMSPILGAEFVAIVGDLSGYRDAGRLAVMNYSGHPSFWAVPPRGSVRREVESTVRLTAFAHRASKLTVRLSS